MANSPLLWIRASEEVWRLVRWCVCAFSNSPVYVSYSLAFSLGPSPFAAQILDTGVLRPLTPGTLYDSDRVSLHTTVPPTGPGSHPRYPFLPPGLFTGGITPSLPYVVRGDLLTLLDADENAAFALEGVVSLLICRANSLLTLLQVGN